MTYFGEGRNDGGFGMKNGHLKKEIFNTCDSPPEDYEVETSYIFEQGLARRKHRGVTRYTLVDVEITVALVRKMLTKGKTYSVHLVHYDMSPGMEITDCPPVRDR